MKKPLALASLLALGLLAPRAASADTFSSGSLIIPMDTSYQDSGMLRAYGLVYALLEGGVHVDWVIRQGKAHLGVDFTASAVDHKSGAVITNHGYRGGPWVIDAADASKAIPIIDAWQVANPSVAVHQATASFSGDVARYLVVAPTIAMHADGNQKIARSYMQAAGIPDSTGDITWPDTSPDMLTPAEVAGPTTTNHHDGSLFDGDGDPVYCQFMSMHWAVTEARASPETVAEVRQFLHNETHFFAECQAVNAFENDPVNGLFLTPHGFLIGGTPGTKVDFYNDDVPFAQIDGAFTSVGGSEPSYSLPAGDTYKAGGVTMITLAGTPEGNEDVWMTGFLDGACPPNAEVCGRLGKVSYLGGHQYDVKLPISKNPTTQGTRLFLNSLFEAPCATAVGQPSISITKSAPATTTSATLTFTLDYDNSGPGVALAVVLKDPLPAGSTFVSATGGGTFAGGTVSWNLGNLGVNEGGSVSVTVSLSGYATYANTAELDYRVGMNNFAKPSNTTSTVYDKDTDGDGIVDSVDICPNDYNPGQDLTSDVNSCGTCGNVCAVSGGIPACVGGACRIAACYTGNADCNGQYGDGCEYPTSGFQTDPANCGSCGKTCSFAHAAAVCMSGACAVGTCNTGYSDCNGVAADGCEYADSGFQTDPNNCGSCGHKCATGFVCTAGSCVVDTCPAGFSDCNGLPGDGCEYDNAGFQSDPANCGGCGLACAPQNGSGTCAGGACTLSACAPGYSDCNGLASDGCEYADSGFQTDPDNCGGCGQACAPVNGSGTCAAGTCTLTACAAGFSDCNGSAADGCEYDNTGFQTDPANCGGCGRACAPANASGACQGGQCAIGTCNAGYVDLDGDPSNGCEYACTKIGATDTTCDGVDDDCNGIVDDGYVPTSCGVGACRADSVCAGGVETCTPGAPSTEGPAGDPTCSDGVDNDCDGMTDSQDPDCPPVADGGAGATGSGGAAGATGSAGASSGGAAGSGAAGAAGSSGASSGGAAGSGAAGAAGGGAAGAAGSSGAASGGAAGASSGGAAGAGTGGSAGSGTGGSATGGGAGSGGSGATSGDAGPGASGSGSGATGGASATSGDQGGCGCELPGDRRSGSPPAWLALALGCAVELRRRRRRATR